jgi:hypothetical protein
LTGGPEVGPYGLAFQGFTTSAVRSYPHYQLNPRFIDGRQLDSWGCAQTCRRCWTCSQIGRPPTPSFPISRKRLVRRKAAERCRASICLPRARGFLEAGPAVEALDREARHTGAWVHRVRAVTERAIGRSCSRARQAGRTHVL